MKEKVNLQNIKAIARARLYAKQRKNYKTDEEFDKAFEESWNMIPLLRKKDKDGNSIT